MRFPTPHPLAAAQGGGVPENLLSLLGTQAGGGQLGMPSMPMPMEALGPAEDEQRQAELARALFDMSRRMKLNPKKTEAMDLIAAAFERFGRSL